MDCTKWTEFNSCGWIAITRLIWAFVARMYGIGSLHIILTLVMLNKLRCHALQIIDINLHTYWQTVQIQISWLLQKPTDLDLHCLKKQYISAFNRTRVNLSGLNCTCCLHYYITSILLIVFVLNWLTQSRHVLGNRLILAYIIIPLLMHFGIKIYYIKFGIYKISVSAIKSFLCRLLNISTISVDSFDNGSGCLETA